MLTDNTRYSIDIITLYNEWQCRGLLESVRMESSVHRIRTRLQVWWVSTARQGSSIDKVALKVCNLRYITIIVVQISRRVLARQHVFQLVADTRSLQYSYCNVSMCAVPHAYLQLTHISKNSFVKPFSILHIDYRICAFEKAFFNGLTSEQMLPIMCIGLI